LRDRDLIVGVLTTQAGFVTPAQVIAAAAGLSEAGSESLLTRLERIGALNQDRRALIEALVDRAITAQAGDTQAVNAALGFSPALQSTLGSAGAAASGANVALAVALEVPPERPGQYLRMKEVGRGSQSVVRAARDQIIGREVALKELSTVGDQAPDSDSARAARARFVREVRLIASLEHPGIVPIHDLARREDGTLFCAQKLIRGETLHAQMARTSSLADRLQLLRHVVDACQAVAYAHDNHIIHRDLKPSNVMVGEFGETVVVDWGLAKLREEKEDAVPLLTPASSSEPALSVAGVALGTPSYMSPEQARGEVAAIDERSDVFSLGAILYELLTGRAPFEGRTATEVLEKVRAGSFPPVLTLVPEAPAELAAIAERALRAEPSERYANGEALAKELSAYLAGGRVGAYRYGAWELLRKFASSHRTFVTGAAIAVAFLLVAATVEAIRLHRARLDLASAFLERAYGAERDADWSKAAGYFAAARAQHDTTEERWGLAVASERMPTRILSLQGPAGAFSDVGVLPDGRIVALGVAEGRIEVRDIESGATLWTHSSEPSFAGGFALQGLGLLSLRYLDHWEFRDGATGAMLASWPRGWGRPCEGRFPPPASVHEGQLLWRGDEGATRVLATDASTDELGGEGCVVSADGRQVAYLAKGWTTRLIEVEGGRELGRAKNDLGWRTAPIFTPHGLVIFQQGGLQVIGSRDGDFTIDLPQRESGSGGRTPSTGGWTVSADGNLVVTVSRVGTTQAMVVDLRNRTIRGVLHYPQGSPQFVFSLDSQRVYAVGFSNASVLKGWLLPEDEMPRQPRWWEVGINSRRGGSSLLLDSVTHRFEFYQPDAERLVASGVRGLGIVNVRSLVGDLPRVASIAPDSTAVVIHDLATDRVLWRQPCRGCSAIAVSDDGSRIAQLGADGIEVWDTRTPKLLFQETKRAPPSKTMSDLSGDGRRLAWTSGEKLFVHDLESQAELTVPLDGSILGIAFDGDGAKMMTVTNRSATLRESATGREIWSVANDVPDDAFCQWTPDGRAVLLRHGFRSTEVLDARSGERLARFQTFGPPVRPVLAEQYSSDLRIKAVVAWKTWGYRPVPPPDPTPADESLARTLQRTGLTLRGVELVPAP
jgi:tRNA A-37 threonylcarbamoyl transferase component Bud32